MKKLFILIFLFSCILIQTAWAQLPQGLNYQAVARNDDGFPLANQTIIVRTGIYDIAASVLDYEEEHKISTNSLGLFTLIVGNGEVINGDFESLEWENKAYGLSVKIDIGNGIQDLGISLLQSVPYAFYAEKSGSAVVNSLNDISDVIVPNPTEGEVIKWDGSNWITSEDIGSSGSTITQITAGEGLSGGGNSGEVLLDAAVNDPIWNAGSIVGRPVGDIQPDIGQVLKWNGSLWEPTNDNSSGGGGSITEITAGEGLSGGGDTGNVAIAAEVDEPIWNAGSLRGGQIADFAPSIGQVLKWNGALWEPVNDNGGEWTESSVTDPAGNVSTYLSTLNNVSVGQTNIFGAFDLEVGGTAAKPGGGSWVALSDRRAKKDISNFLPGLNEILKIRPVWYSYNENSPYATTEKYVGIIAQELAEIAPYMVNTIEIADSEMLIVDPSAFQYMMINAIKEQQRLIEELKNKIEKLTNKEDE